MKMAKVTVTGGFQWYLKPTRHHNEGEYQTEVTDPEMKDKYPGLIFFLTFCTVLYYKTSLCSLLLHYLYLIGKINVTNPNQDVNNPNNDDLD